MDFEELVKLYNKYRDKFGVQAYKHITELLQEAKKLHKIAWQRTPTPNQDHEQSWRAFKGKNLEKLIMHIIKDGVESLGLKIVNGNTLERTNTRNLPVELNRIKRNLLIDYGEFGSHIIIVL